MRLRFGIACCAQVNDRMQTSLKHVFAVGDCCSQFKFTHVSDFMARAVIRNALFFGSSKFSSFLIPWATFTEPEIAHVGMCPGSKQVTASRHAPSLRHSWRQQKPTRLMHNSKQHNCRCSVWLHGEDVGAFALNVAPVAGN